MDLNLVYFFECAQPGNRSWEQKSNEHLLKVSESIK